MQHSLNFDNLDGKLAQDEAEHRHAESKLTTEDNIEQEPNVKAIESTAGNKGGTSTKKLADTDKSATELKDNATGVQRKPLSEIHTDEGRFQERFKLNEQIVNNIAEKFSYADQDPIHVWTDPKDGKTYVLSGHHRYYGAKKAGIINVKIQDRTGDFTEAQAIEFATEEANANRSMGTPLERANTLRKKRKKGDSKEDIQKFLDKEGKNKNYVENLSHLNPDGKTITSLISLEESSDKVTQKESEKIADWIGEARKQNKNLTDQHENELFDFLMNKNSSKRITTKAELISKIASITGTLDFDPSKPLNIERYKYKSEGEKQYDKEVEERKDKISELQQKINDINDRFKNPNNPNYVSTDHKDYDSIKAQADKVIADTNVQLKAEQKALQELYQQKGKYTNAGSNQSALFQKGESNTETTPEQKKEAKSVISFLNKKFPNLFARGQKAFEEKVKQIMNPRFQALQNKLVNQYDFLFNGKPVAELTGKEFEAKEGVTLKQQVNDFFNFIGNKVNSTFGEVILDNRAYKDDSSHGQGREKVSAYKALPEILKNGMEVLPMGQHKADIKLKSGMIAAPITIDGKEYIAIAVVRQNKEGDNRLYVHEVTLKEKLLDSSSNPVLSETTQATNQGAIAKVLQNIVDAKNNPLKFMADYHGWHKAPRKEGKNSLDDMSDVFPDDLYSPKGFYYYADDKSSKADKESYKAIVAAKGKPNKKVKVYRAVPKGVTEINSGDWVTLSKEYAKKHGEHSLDDNYDIIETEVEANKLFNEGSINEFGIQFLKDKNGTIFGLYDPTENKIYLNERNLNPKTVWHEATHFQQAILKAMAQNGNKEAIKILAQFDKLLKPFVEQLLLGRTTVTIDGQRIPLKADVYRKGANETTKAYKERMQDEVWAFLQQEKNNKLWQKNDTPFKRAVNKFREAITNLYKSVFNIPKGKDISNMTLSELVGHTAKQLQDGRLDSVVKGEKGEVRMMTMPDGTKRQVKVLPEVTNGFYSPIEKKLLDEKAENLSATKWLERLGKGDEMTFTGLKDFLESKKPNEQVKKSELQDFMRDNRIEVVEVVKGGDASEAEIDAFLEDEVGEGYTREEAREYLSNDETNEQTKYGQYQLPGEKENYKEVLVTMPSKKVSEYSIKERPSPRGVGVMYDVVHNKTNRVVSSHRDAAEAMDNLKQYNKNIVEDKQMNFKSTHFDEPNILVHLRMNTRTDSEGNKVLFLEEVQSDWGQTGKKDGFKTSENVWDTQLGKDAVAAIKDMDNLGFDSWQQAATAISKSKDPLNDFDIKYKHKDLILKWRDAVNQERKTSIAPFVTDTNAWTKLGLKVALKEAVAQGADKIAWTTGEQQNERYDLSKQVDYIDVFTNDDGTYEIEAVKGNNSIAHDKSVPADKLESLLGKELATKILEDTKNHKHVEGDENLLKTYRGKDLQVGGSGMKGFYGSPTESKLGIVGNVAKKLFGQEPSAITLQDGTTQHAVSITPEMREQVQEGQPLFMAGEENLTPITKEEHTILNDHLNKAFGGAVNHFDNWKEFIGQNKSLQGFKSLDEVVFSQTLDKVNKAFNEQLDKLVKGTLPKGHIFQLGNAGAILKASGIEELPIELSADRTKEKSEQPNHPFDLNDLKNLTKAVQNPIAVFDSTKKDGSKIILTELKDKKGNNYVVALRVSNKGAGRLNVEINDVKSVYPKDHTQGVLDWINSEGNLLRYADKEKALNYISVQSTNLIGNGNTEKGSNTKIQHKLNNAVEKIKNFKNPISDKEVDDVRFSVNKNYIGEALYIINKNAKKLRDLKRDLYNFQKYGDVTSGLAERAGVSEFNFSEEKNSLVVYDENDKAYYDIKDIEDAIKNQEREVSFIENNDNYDEDELDFEKSYLNNLESIKETFENNIEKIKGVYMSDLSDELNRLYEFKGKVISKIGGKAIGAHVFPKGDVRELYKIGDFVFHGEDVSDDYTKEEILKLDKLGEISSDIKIDNIKSLEDAISEIEKKLGIQFMQLPDGTIYGAVLPDGSMYLNPEKLNANTPIHEHTHLFNQVIQQTNPKLWNRMVEAVKGIGLWNEVKNDPNYKNLKTDSQIADEVYSRLTGNKGEVNWQERIAKADSKSRLAKVGELIKEYWNNVMDILGIKKMSADDFANMTLDKLFSGKEIKGVKDVLEAGNNLNNQIKSATDNVGTFSNESNDIRFSISNDGGQNLSDAEREEIRADLKTGLKLGNTIDELREMYAGTDEINISENDFSDLMSEAQKEFETEKSGKTTKIDDDTEKDNDIQDTPKENKKDNRKKTYEWHRVHEGKFPKELIENLEKYDLDHEVENQELAEKRALAIIDNFGIENALKSVEKGYITGAEKAVVFSKAVEAIQAEMQLEIDLEIREKLAEDLGDIIRKTGDEMRDAGRFSAMWARIYKNSPLGYNAEYYINKYKESNNGEISKEMEDKFRELEETIKEQNAKIIELEKKQEEEIDKQIVESIVNNPPNKKDSKDKKSIKEKSKQLADKFRKFKTKPFTLKDADGNDIIIKQNSIVNYNDIIEAGAKIIEEAGRLGESIEMAIRKAREYVVSELEKQDWYKKLPQRDKDAVNTQLLEHFSIENTIESEYKISKGLLYELTKAGIERKGKDNYTIDDLVDDVYDIYKEQYPDLEKRQIRDDISNYGKTIDLSEEEIDVKLRNLRRDGKMLSAYEDLLNGNLPKRSGLQRDELTPSQREMQKKINDELRKIPKSAEQLKNAWKSALDAIKRKYQNQIEDLEKQIAKRERIVKILNRTELDDKANNLKARVEELKAELDELVGKKEMSEESKLRLVESNLKKSIEKTQDKIDYINKNGVEPKTPKNKSVTSNKIEELTEELKFKKEQLKLIREEKGLVEKKRLEMAKKRVAKQIDDLKERIANGDFSKKKRKPLPYDNELNDAKREKLKAQKEFELALYQNELANRGKFEIAKDALFEALNIPKGMLATLDMSAPLRQGSMLIFSNPIIFAKSFLKMHGFAFNSSKFENAQLDIENHKDYVLMHESGLGLTSPDVRLMAREELFMQRLPKMIPIFSQLHSGSERAYTGFLNELRVNVFLSGVEKLKEAGLSFESNSKAFKDLAKYVNYATGRGDTTTSEGLNKVLNTVFFSPKMITSRIQMFMLAINPNTTPQVRTMAIKSLLSFATYIASVGALSMAVVGKTMLGSDDDDENFKNFINPIHTDFAKIRKGDYVYDVTAGYAPLIRTIARMGVMAKISASGKKTELNGKGFRGETGISELGNFFENKLSPLARVVYSMPFLTNKNPNLNKFKETWRDTPPDELIKDIAKSLFIPISVGDIYQNLTDEEIKWYQATTNITLGMYGVGINKYSNKPTPSKQNKMGGGNGFGGK